MEIGKSISGQSTYHRLFFFTWGANKFAQGVAFGDAERYCGFLDSYSSDPGIQSASYDAIVNNGYDAIAFPQYTVEDFNMWVYRSITYGVKGVGLKLKGAEDTGYTIGPAGLYSSKDKKVVAPAVTAPKD